MDLIFSKTQIASNTSTLCGGLLQFLSFLVGALTIMLMAAHGSLGVLRSSDYVCTCVCVPSTFLGGRTLAEQQRVGNDTIAYSQSARESIRQLISCDGSEVRPVGLVLPYLGGTF